ncbi:MAG: SGNH/GDSL hydrolase family protein [Acidimicrobiia bacterium]|nr:SGNH/GDSL hydrolase family protein [Acidimicrobiia bacterium]
MMTSLAPNPPNGSRTSVNGGRIPASNRFKVSAVAALLALTVAACGGGSDNESVRSATSSTQAVYNALGTSTVVNGAGSTTTTVGLGGDETDESTSSSATTNPGVTSTTQRKAAQASAGATSNTRGTAVTRPATGPGAPAAPAGSAGPVQTKAPESTNAPASGPASTAAVPVAPPVASTAPAPPAPEPDPEPEPGGPYRYVAFGDSYAAGSGSGPDDLSAACYRSSNSYPARVAAALSGRGYEVDFTHDGCAGYRTGDVAGNLGLLDDDTDLVTITIGGNNVTSIGVGGQMAACVAVSCSLEPVRSQVGGISGNLTNLFNQIRAAAPNATILAVSYPLITDGGVAPCDRAPGITSGEFGIVRAWFAQVNATMAASAGAAGIGYVDVGGSVAGHEVCAPDAWILGLVAQLGFSGHPTAAGHAQIAGIVAGSI